MWALLRGFSSCWAFGFQFAKWFNRRKGKEAGLGVVRCEYCVNFDFNSRKCVLKGAVNPYEAEKCAFYFISWEYHPEKLRVTLAEMEKRLSHGR